MDKKDDKFSKNRIYESADSVDLSPMCLEDSADIEHVLFYLMELVGDIASLDGLVYSLDMTYDDLDDLVEAEVKKLNKTESPK